MSSFIINPLDPVFDSNSKILILGTMPSPRSRSAGFYYSHPQNRFWRVMSAVLEAEIPETPDGRAQFMLGRRIALWDVLSECVINKADDASIREPVVNDLSLIFDNADIKAVFTTGKKAEQLYRSRCMNAGNSREPIYLPSTSPANCGNITFDRLVEHYKEICRYL